ncbi:RNA polymerase sporulation sigma factor SigH [Lachnospiraceae bacterium 47-T17]
MKEKSYEGVKDEELLAELSGGNDSITDYLCNKYKHLVTREANALYLIGAEKEDLIQEGMIGLFKAIRDFSSGKESSFYTFARLCIRRQMYHAIEASKRLKHVPLNSYISFSEETGEESGLTVGDTLEADGEQNPERLLIQQENYQDFFDRLASVLSPMEKQVCDLYLQGMDYRQIAEELEKPPKSIDNALQRIRTKMGRSEK